MCNRVFSLACNCHSAPSAVGQADIGEKGEVVESGDYHTKHFQSQENLLNREYQNGHDSHPNQEETNMVKMKGDSLTAGRRGMFLGHKFISMAWLQSLSCKGLQTYCQIQN